MQNEIIVLEEAAQEFEEFLEWQIKSFNNEHSPWHKEARQPGVVKPLNLIVQDESGAIVGGIAARTFWKCIYIDNFYLPDALRGRGIGSALLTRAEEIAVQRGARRSFLSTFGFQARSFYEKCGYVVVGTLEDYPPGSALYWLRKDFR